MKKLSTLIYICSILVAANFASLKASANAPYNIPKLVEETLNDKELSDSLKVKKITEYALIDHYIYPGDHKYKTYIRKAINLANRIKGYDSKLRAYSAAVLFEEDVDKRALLIDTCILYIPKTQSPEIRSIAWESIGTIQKDTPEAVQYFFNALEEVKGTAYWEQEHSVCHNIASFYRAKSDYPNHVKYNKQALDAAIRGKSDYNIADSWTNLGVAYMEVPSGDFMDDAEKAFLTALDIYKDKLENIQAGNGTYLYQVILNNLSALYINKEEYKAAGDYLNEALLLALQENNTDIQIECYYKLNKVASAEKNYSSAERYLVKASELLSDKNFTLSIENSHLPYMINLELAELYTKMERYADAAKYYAIGVDKYREEFDAQLATNSQKMTAGYEVEQKKLELQNLNETLALKKQQNTLYIILVIILLIGLGLLFYTQRFRIKAAKAREKHRINEAQLIQMRKQQAELKAKVNAQESDRLQKELNAGNTLVEHKNKILENLKLLFANNSELKPYKKQLESILMQEGRVESNVEDYKTGLQDVHPDFYTLLQERADNKLTSLDLKYCRLILLKVSSKEMADTLHVDPKTIRVSKYRLKQKLKLGKEEDLNTFIENII